MQQGRSHFPVDDRLWKPTQTYSFVFFPNRLEFDKVVSTLTGLEHEEDMQPIILRLGASFKRILKLLIETMNTKIRSLFSAGHYASRKNILMPRVALPKKLLLAWEDSSPREADIVETFRKHLQEGRDKKGSLITVESEGTYDCATFILQKSMDLVKEEFVRLGLLIERSHSMALSEMQARMTSNVFNVNVSTIDAFECQTIQVILSLPIERRRRLSRARAMSNLY